MYFLNNKNFNNTYSFLKCNLYELGLIYEGLDNLENFIESILPINDTESIFELSEEIVKLKEKIKKEIDFI